MKKNIFLFLFIVSIVTFLFFVKNRTNDQFTDFKSDVEIGWGNSETARKESEEVVSKLFDTNQNYKDQALKISFNYPENFRISSFREDDEYILLVQDINKKLGLQVSAFSFSDPFNSLTEERIENDLGIEISKYRIIKVGKLSDIDAITFLTDESPVFRETWFVNGSSLIQVKSYESTESLMIAMLQTLEIF